MIIRISDPRIKQAIQIMSENTKGDKRILSPNPDSEPCWHHYVRVYSILMDYEVQDKSTLLASILHDSLEDGYLSKKELEESFGSRVLEIVLLLSEAIDNNPSKYKSRDLYFNKILNYDNVRIRNSAMRIKIADRYDNLVGLSYTNYTDKKKQYMYEINAYLFNFAKIVNMQELLSNGVEILQGVRKPTDLEVEIKFKG